MSNNQYKKNPKEISLKSLEEILDIISLIESDGIFFGKSKNENLSAEKISDLLSQLYTTKKLDWSRSIKTAKKIFNSTSEYGKIEGNKKGSFFNLAKNKILKEDKGYKALFVLGLACLVLDDSLNIDFLNQFFQQEFPLSFLMFLRFSIEKKIILSLSYKSDRTNELVLIPKLVPLKINFRDGHWILIGYSIEKNMNFQYLIHNILKVEFYKSKSGNKYEFELYEKDLNFSLKEFYKNSFGLSVFNSYDFKEVTIQVTKEFKSKVTKRRREGEWIEKKDFFHWKIRTQNLDEIFEYIFRWNGNLKIISPIKAKKEFQKKIKLFLE